MKYTSTKHDVGEDINPPDPRFEDGLSDWSLMATHVAVSLVNTDEVHVVAIWVAVIL